MPSLNTHLQVPNRQPIPWELAASVVHDSHVTEGVGPALTDLHATHTGGQARTHISQATLRAALLCVNTQAQL